jgi:DNA-binding MarR family transcriptional regulator/N-acetylglutamate synthase-like GNAT family acetyltransferase
MTDLPAPLDQRVDAVRRFNRLYTRRIGVLDEGYLHSPFSLAEVRVMYELAQRPRLTATELVRDLELDPGYLSRILQRLAQRGLVARRRSERDGRESWLSLTPSGHDAFAPLDSGARAQVRALLHTLAEPDQQRLVAALETIERILGEPARDGDQTAYVLREHRPGDMGWVVQRHGALYAQEYGFDTQFEALVAHIVAKFIDHFDAARERCWIAERNGRNVGCIFLVKASRRTAKLRLFLVEPEARGLGLGHRLVDECLRFAREAGYRRVRLWTQSNLLAARHIYEQFGFARIAQEAHHSYSQDLIAETWERWL